MSVYENIYNLINEYIFNNSIVVGSYQELVAILFSTCACIFMLCLPFLIVIKIIKSF